MRRVVDCGDSAFEKLEVSIKNNFLRSLLKYDVSDTIRDLCSLPVKMGGFGIENPSKDTNFA